MGPLRLLSLPIRAPLIVVLFAVAVVMGNQWALVAPAVMQSKGLTSGLLLTGFELLQLLVLLVICTMPDLLLRRVSLLMASSRAMTLLVTLLMVIGSALYVMRLNVLSDVLIIASALLLARLDLIRIGIRPTPRLSMLLLGSVLLGGVALGHLLPHPSLALFAEPQGGL